MKKTLLALSFGTSYPDAEESCIAPVERALSRAFPDWTVCRAYTSRIIVRKLRERGVPVESETEALNRLRGEGPVAIASTHIIPGEEYERAAALAEAFKISEPLLANDADLRWMAALLAGIAREEGHPLLLMGHGTAHAANEVYLRLKAYLPEDVFIACVEGSMTLDDILPALEALPEKCLTLMPLMLVSGDHARNDLAGEEDSWKSVLEARGFDVRTRLQGLGALPEVQQRFVEKVRKLGL